VLRVRQDVALAVLRAPAAAPGVPPAQDAVPARDEAPVRVVPRALILQVGLSFRDRAPVPKPSRGSRRSTAGPEEFHLFVP